MSRRRRGNRQRMGTDYAGSCRKMNSRKRAGWGRNLYRNTREGKIAGVCAGFADYFDIACERIRKAYDQPDLFVEQPEPKPVQEPLL